MARLAQKAIWQAFQAMLEEMPFDKITVSALVKRAGVSPNTFYYHYQDIYDLLRVWFHTILNQQVDIHAPDFHWQSATKTLLHICQAHPKIVYHIFDSLSRNQLERYVFSLTDDVFYQQVCRQTQGSGLTQSQLKEVAQFCRYAFVGFLLQFVWNRMEADVDESVDRLGTLFTHFVDSTALWLGGAGQADLRNQGNLS